MFCSPHLNQTEYHSPTHHHQGSPGKTAIKKKKQCNPHDYEIDYSQGIPNPTFAIDGFLSSKILHLGCHKWFMGCHKWFMAMTCMMYQMWDQESQIEKKKTLFHYFSHFTAFEAL